ncbi:hypothetical protein M0Q50_09785 [bacterium]|jgi:hypothetical protein|nr:hypothetical protein [bacterium]
MNRKERRATSKKLGIMQYQQKLPFDKKLNLIRNNILSGKKLDEEFREETRLNIQSQLEEKESQRIYSLAESITKNEGIPMIDAIEKAKKQR